MAIQVVSSTSLRVTWDPPVGTNCAITYRVEYSPLNIGMCSSQTVSYREVQLTINRVATINNLKPYSKYRVRVRAELADGSGSSYKTKDETTAEAGKIVMCQCKFCCDSLAFLVVQI